MFKNCKTFDKDLKNLITFKVEDMASMFEGASNFNKPINTNYIRWDVINVKNMNSMFKDALYLIKILIIGKQQMLQIWDICFIILYHLIKV